MSVRDLLGTTYYGNTVAAWLIALAVLLGGWGALVLARSLLVRRLERFADRTSTYLDDLALRGLRHTSRAFLFVLALSVAAETAVVLPPNVAAAVRLVATLAFLLQAARWGNGAITFWTEHISRQRAATDKASLSTIAVLGVLARVVLWALILLVALDAFGINVATLVTGLGIAGVAVALAVQNVLGDLFASLSIALDKPFVIGDSIAFETFNGTVEDIGLKTTRLRSLSGEQIIVSNAELLKARIRNWTRQTERRIQFNTALAFDTPPELAERAPQLLRDIIARQELVRLDRSHVVGFGESSINVETVYIMLTADYTTYADTHQRILLEMMRRFRAEGIALAPPPRAVVVLPPQPGAPADGDGVREEGTGAPRDAARDPAGAAEG
jgi:small-conductance mechanosensitive channel